MGLLDDLGLTSLIKEAQQIKQEFESVKKEVVDTVADQSKIVGEIKGSAETITSSITSQVSDAVAEAKSGILGTPESPKN
jgi:hypothetical protein